MTALLSLDENRCTDHLMDVEDEVISRNIVVACSVVSSCVLVTVCMRNESEGSAKREARAGEKRKRQTKTNVMEELNKAFKAIAEAIKQTHSHWMDELMAKLLKYQNDGYDDANIEAAFDILYKDEMEGRAFIAKTHSMNLRWLKKFVDAEKQNE